jgi:hypothetical protein
MNGIEYAKQQLIQKGIAFQALDNGVLSCDPPQRLQAICDRLSAERVEARLRKWLRLLPHPLYGRGSKGRIPLSVVYPPGEVLADSSAGLTRHRPRVPLRSDPREPRPGPPQSGTIDLNRRVSKTTPVGFARVSSPTVWSPRSTWITKERA